MYKLLIADDEEIEINAFKLMISNYFSDISILTANSGIEALFIARAEKPDIIFMDIEMPVYDGLTVIGELKKELPESRFIAHTAYSSFEYAQKAIKVGADDYLLKPVKMQTMLGIVRDNMAEVDKKRSKAIETQQFVVKQAKFKPFIERDIVSSVVNGVEGQETLIQYAAMFDFQMTRGFCAIFKISNVYGVDSSAAPENVLKAKKEIALEIIETLRQVCQCIASEYVSGSVLAIIPFEKPLSEYDIRQWSVQLANFVCSRVNHMAVLRVGIGTLTTLEHIYTSYYEAYKTINDNALDVTIKHHDDFVQKTESPENLQFYEVQIGKLIIFKKTAEALKQAEYLFNCLMFPDKPIDKFKTSLTESCFIIKRFVEANTFEGFSINFGGNLGIISSLTNYDAIKCWLYDFIKSTIAQMESSSGKRSSAIISEAKMYIEKNFNTEITLEGVAASVCVTSYYLSKLFKKETGKNFSTYLTQFRIDKAKELFRSTNKSIKTVAYDTGFNSQAYFSKIFKKIVGVSPSEFIGEPSEKKEHNMELKTSKIDPATLQTAAGLPDIKSMNDSLVFDTDEVSRLRDLASRVAEIAALPVQAEKARLWTKHNDLKTTQPLVFIDPECGWNECIPADTLTCCTPMARVWEMFLKKQIYWFEVLKDDKVIEPYFNVPYSFSDTGWGVTLDKEGGQHGGAYKIKPAISDYQTDFDKVRYPQIVIDQKESADVLELAQEVFDGLLTVRRKPSWWWTLGMTWEFINLRGLEEFMCDLIDEPDYVHRFMNLLCEGVLARLDFLQENGYLATNADNTYVGSGGFGFTDELPTSKEKVTTMNMWGFVESQETVAVSPEMYNEFIFPYHNRILERFGLNCYGCCEGFDTRWKYAKHLPRLRRVSVSAWANWEKVEEYLGRNYIASVKPNPAHLALSNINEDAARAEIKKALASTKNGVPEIIMKDNNTLGNNPRNAARWVEIVREEIEKL